MRTISENILKQSVFALILLMWAFQTYAMRGLYADGAYFLVRILEKQAFFDTNESQRLFMYWFTQFPTVLAIKLDVTNLSFLTYLFCGWLSFAPLLFWLLGLWKLKNDFLFWPFLGLFSLIYFAANFFIIGEYNLSYAISAFCFACMLPKQKLRVWERIILLSAAIILTMTYASTLFMGPLLAVTALHKTKGENLLP